MKREYRLTDEELLDKSHFPVKALFDMVSDTRFLKVIEGISQGKGFGENYGACVFWNDLDEYDRQETEKYEGAEFGLNSGEEIIIDYNNLYYYLKIICHKYIEDFPNSTNNIDKILRTYHNQYIEQK